MMKGTFTALITPFGKTGVNEEGLNRLVDFQLACGIDGILAVGTTGESPTLTWEEHNWVIDAVAKKTKNKCLCIAGTGSNNTAESLAATRHAAKLGVDAVLLVDPYYNGPSSLEIRREYIEPIAAAFPELRMIPYVIPGRTGAQLMPEDLAILKKTYSNVDVVKEATGNIENMRKTRTCCGEDYTILSGDDPMTFEMMADPAIKASGVISVMSNIAPKAMVDMVGHLNAGQQNDALKLKTALDPLFGLVTVKTEEDTLYGRVVCRARNPLALKTLMAVLGLPAGGCRPPMGKMTRKGLDKVIQVAKSVQQNTPEIFRPAAEFFNIDIDDRLNTPDRWKGLYYESY